MDSDDKYNGPPQASALLTTLVNSHVPYNSLTNNESIAVPLDVQRAIISEQQQQKQQPVLMTTTKKTGPAPPVLLGGLENSAEFLMARKKLGDLLSRCKFSPVTGRFEFSSLEGAEEATSILFNFPKLFDFSFDFSKSNTNNLLSILSPISPREIPQKITLCLQSAKSELLFLSKRLGEISSTNEHSVLKKIVSILICYPTTLNVSSSSSLVLQEEVARNRIISCPTESLRLILPPKWSSIFEGLIAHCSVGSTKSIVSFLVSKHSFFQQQDAFIYGGILGALLKNQFARAKDIIRMNNNNNNLVPRSKEEISEILDMLVTPYDRRHREATQKLLDQRELWIDNIFQFLGPGYYVYVAGVSKAFKVMYGSYFSKLERANIPSIYVRQPLLKRKRLFRTATGTDTFYSAAFSSVACAEFWDQHSPVSNGRLPNNWVCRLAAKYGNLDVLKWVRQGPHKFPWDASTCSHAASSGRLEVLQWARENGCPWNEETCSFSAAFGHLEILQWARANNCPWDDHVCLYAARYDHSNVLQWAQDNFCPSDPSTNYNVCLEFARSGKLNYLEKFRWRHLLEFNVLPKD